MAGQRHDTTAKKAAFLKAFLTAGTVLHAAKAAKIDRHSHYRWMKEDEEYAAAFRDAEVGVTELLEHEAQRRAKDGVEEPVFHDGAIVGHKLKYSDLLMIFLLKARAPHKYREVIRNEHSGDVNIHVIYDG